MPESRTETDLTLCPICTARPRRVWPATFGSPEFRGSTCGAHECEHRWNEELKQHVLAEENQREDVIADRALRMGRRGIPPIYHHDSDSILAGRDIAEYPCNMLIYGPNGSGKTTVAAALMDRWRAGVFVTAYRILAEIRATFRQRAEESELEVVERYSDLALLVIDDLGAENKTDFTLAALLAIIQQRGDWRRPTIVTTNLSLAEIDKLDPRLASRLAAYTQLKTAGQRSSA